MSLGLPPFQPESRFSSRATTPKPFDSPGQRHLLSRSMSPENETERALAQLFHAKAQSPFVETDFHEVRRLLEAMGKTDSCQIPRTYAVLHIVGRPDLADEFWGLGCRDIHFPYSQRTLPPCLKSSSERSRFLEVQGLIRLKAFDLEESGAHRHISNESEYFITIAELGKGGFGRVDHVRSRLSAKEFARKRIPRGNTFKNDQEVLSKFEEELKYLKRLSHHHLVKFVGSYSAPKYVTLITSPVAKRNLAEHLRQGPFSSNEVSILRTFFGCLTAAIRYMHGENIRHKDIKPENILVNDSTVLITDFGTALDWTLIGNSQTCTPSPFTPKYCSPQVANHIPRGSASDVWSLGCVFLEMVSVLKGESLSQMDSFFAAHDGAVCVRTNRQAAKDWMEHLHNRQGALCDNEPLGWIHAMIEEEERDRIGIDSLYGLIFEYNGPFCFYGACCSLDEAETDTDAASNSESPISETRGSEWPHSGSDPVSLNTEREAKLNNKHTVRPIYSAALQKDRHSNTDQYPQPGDTTMNTSTEQPVISISPPPLPPRRCCSVSSRDRGSRTAKLPPPPVPPPLRAQMQNHHRPSLKVAHDAANAMASTLYSETVQASGFGRSPVSSTLLAEGATTDGAPKRSRSPFEAHSDQTRSVSGLKTAHRRQIVKGIDYSDPAIQSILDELVRMGTTKDELESNKDFVLSYIEQKQKVERTNSDDRAFTTSTPPASARIPDSRPHIVPHRWSGTSTQTDQRLTSPSELKALSYRQRPGHRNIYKDRTRAASNATKTGEDDLASSASLLVNRPKDVRLAPFTGSAVRQLPPNACFEEINSSSTDKRDGKLTNFKQASANSITQSRIDRLSASLSDVSLSNEMDPRERANKLQTIESEFKELVESVKNKPNRDLLMEELKMMQQKLSACQQAMSNVYNTMHENAMNPIRNIKA